MPVLLTTICNSTQVYFYLWAISFLSFVLFVADPWGFLLFLFFFVCWSLENKIYTYVVRSRPLNILFHFHSVIFSHFIFISSNLLPPLSHGYMANKVNESSSWYFLSHPPTTNFFKKMWVSSHVGWPRKIF